MIRTLEPSSFVTTQYGVKPTASMVAEKPAPYGVKKPQPQSQPKNEVALDLSAVKEGLLSLTKLSAKEQLPNLMEVKSELSLMLVKRHSFSQAPSRMAS